MKIEFIKSIVISSLIKLILFVSLAYADLKYLTDYESFTTISEFFNVSLKANPNVTYRLAPINRTDMFYYLYSSGNKLWSPIVQSNDSITISVNLSGVFLLCEDNAQTNFYSIRFDHGNNFFIKDPVTPSTSLAGFKLYQFSKSVMLFMAFIFLFFLTDIVLRVPNSKIRMLANVFFCFISFCFVFFFLYKEFYIGLFS